MTTCPICSQQLKKENKNIKTLLMYYDYVVYSCQKCDYTIDFTNQEYDIRALVVAAAFRKMIEDLKLVHGGASLEKSQLTHYKNFVSSIEFKLYEDLWIRNESSFYQNNKHLLIHV